MKNKIFLLILCCLVNLCASSSNFWGGNYDFGKDLPKDKVYPQGRIFPFSGFQPSSVVDIKNSQFTMSGLGYGARIPLLLKECKKLNFPIIYPIVAKIDGVAINKKLLSDKNANFNFEEIAKDIAKQVKDASKEYPSIAWWYIVPEELRYWRKNEIKYLKVAYEQIRKNDPQKRPTWMYIPNHYSINALKKYVDVMDIMGKGAYANYSSKTKERVWVRWSGENQEKSIANKKDKFTICVPEMFQEPKKELINKIPSWVRHDVYASLICGAKGVVVFSLAQRKGFPSHNIYFDSYKKIANELNGKSNLAQVFLFGKKCNDLKITQMAGEKEVILNLGKEKLKYVPVAFSNISYKNNRYLFMVNSSEKPVKYVVSNLPKVKIAIVDAVSGKKITESSNGSFEVNFDALDVKLYKIVKL